ncbi:hypothetical protein NS331_18825 [Pseudacidovorax intermedius]|uniref:Uncharacterized protein n=1 Tax=Pseudacidovorax intermedius TaxID=433924 RepID=A0A147GPB8_9BURK|nr:hypothetical protein NS331_18825 [Pseudacidovorax intermedius]
MWACAWTRSPSPRPEPERDLPGRLRAVRRMWWAAASFLAEGAAGHPRPLAAAGVRTSTP